eukprot:116641-Pleurochrysis_carterae.AAC.1
MLQTCFPKGKLSYPPFTRGSTFSPYSMPRPAARRDSCVWVGMKYAWHAFKSIIAIATRKRRRSSRPSRLLADRATFADRWGHTATLRSNAEHSGLGSAL